MIREFLGMVGNRQSVFSPLPFCKFPGTLLACLLLTAPLACDQPPPPTPDKPRTAQPAPAFVDYQGDRFWRVKTALHWQYPTARTPDKPDFYRCNSFNPLVGRYGWTRSQGLKFHEGVDIAGIEGKTAVRAVAAGRAVRVDKYDNRSYGKMVILEHAAEQVFSLYAHLASVCVHRGQIVPQGQVLGYVGRTGNAHKLPRTESHLHFEVDVLQDPQAPLKQRYKGGNLEGINPLVYIKEGRIVYGRLTILGTWAHPDGSLRQFFTEKRTLRYHGQVYCHRRIFAIWRKLGATLRRQGMQLGGYACAKLTPDPQHRGQYTGQELGPAGAVSARYEIYRRGKRLRITVANRSRPQILVRTIHWNWPRLHAH